MLQLMMAFEKVKSAYKRNQVDTLTTAELRSMGNIACGISATDITRIDPAIFWYDKLIQAYQIQLLCT